jgi:hypothetical protein
MTLAALVALLIVGGVGLFSVPASAQDKKPNILFILADNIGYGDIGVYGGGELRGAPTPRIPDDRPIDGVDQADLLLGRNDTGRREHLLTFVGPTLVAVRWKQFRTNFADIAPGRSGWRGEHLLGGTGGGATPMNGYPKVFNVESDPREEYNIGAMYEWVFGPVLKAVAEYRASLEKHPNPPAAKLTRW